MAYQITTTLTRPSTSVDWYTETSDKTDFQQNTNKYILAGSLKVNKTDGSDGLSQTVVMEFATKDAFVDWFFDDALNYGRILAQAHNTQHGIIAQSLDRRII